MVWSRGDPRWSRVVGAVAGVAGLAALQVCVFGPAFRVPFVLDDFVYLNRVGTTGWLWSGPQWDLRSSLFRPGLYVVFGFLHTVFGLRPGVFHVVSAALVLAAACVVGLVAHRLGLRLGAIAAATIYALHAAMATPVAWASATNSPLAVALALGAVYLLLPKRVGPIRVAASCVLFALALLTREVVTVVPLMLVVAVLFSRVSRWKSRVRPALLASAPLWGVLIVYVGARRLAGYEVPTTGTYAQHLGLHAVSNLGRLMELATDVAPARDGVHRPVTVTLFWLSLVGASVLLRRARPQACIGVLWFFLGALPVIFLSGRPMSFYYVDLAMVGVAIAAGTAFESVAGALSQRPRAAFAVGCLAFFVVVSHDTAQQQLKERQYVFADATTEFVRRVQRDNPRPQPAGLIVVWYRDSDPRFITANGDLFRVRYHDPTLRVLHLRATGETAKLIRIGSANWVGVVVPPNADPLNCSESPRRRCVAHAIAGMLPTAKAPAVPAVIPARRDYFATTVMTVFSVRRLFVILGAVCFGYLGVAVTARRRGGTRRLVSSGAAENEPSRHRWGGDGVESESCGRGSSSVSPGAPRDHN